MERLISQAATVVRSRVFSVVRPERGQTLAEYGVLISVLAVFVVVIAVLGYADAITNVFSGMVSCLSGTC